MIYVQYDANGYIIGAVNQEQAPDCDNYISVDVLPGADQMVDIATGKLKAKPATTAPSPAPPSPPPTA